MKKIIIASLALMALAATPSMAGGILTNTNQNLAFNRMMSREASIGIDGVYSNPAGVAFMADGFHLSVNWQMAFQTRTVENTYTPFALNTERQSDFRKYKGKASAPVIPSFQTAYNKNGWSFQMNFAMTGGGGKCTFDEGLGSFERIIANAAAVLPTVAAGIDGVAQQTLGQSIGMGQMFPTGTGYSYSGYMRGRQYYFGLSLGVARKFSEQFSAFVGVRGVYGTANYYGYLKDITLGQTTLNTLLGGSGGDIELNCDQSGFGVTPIIGVDFRPNKHWNFSARYEFKTRMRLKNKAVNQVPDVSLLSYTLPVMIADGMQAQGMPEQTAQAAANAVMDNATVKATIEAMSGQLSSSIDESIGEFDDGKKIPADIPALLTIGAGYSPIDALRINVGFHYFFDKKAKAYQDRQKLLSRGTIEWNAGAEYDLCKAVTVSAGWQNTNYGLTDEYMDDKSFVTSSNSFGFGACLHLTKKVDLNVAYFSTFYSHKKTSEADDVTQYTYTVDYTRTNRVFGIGVDVNF